jgi:DNA-binding GntR family transcriptional regulator
MRLDISSRLQAGRLHEALTGQIVDQHYKAGERLSLGVLAEEFAVSLAPLRAAAARLARDGLVRLSPCGEYFTVTAPPDGAWMEELLSYRLLIETSAVGLIARQRPTETLRRMRAAVRSDVTGESLTFGAFRMMHDADKEFHAAIVEGTGNRVTIRAYRDLQPHLHYARLFYSGAARNCRVMNEHGAIVAAVERGEVAKAEETLRAHIEETHAFAAAFDAAALFRQALGQAS